MAIPGTVVFKEGDDTDVPTPDAGKNAVFFDSADGKPYYKDDGGTVNPFGGITDGDKGDVTVSDDGDTWTIDNGAVTYAKMQDVSADQRVLGRSAGSSGDVQELTVTGGSWSAGDLKVAPPDAQYVTLATNGTLSNERVLTAGSNISLTDGGAGSTITVAADAIPASGYGFNLHRLNYTWQEAQATWYATTPSIETYPLTGWLNTASGAEQAVTFDNTSVIKSTIRSVRRGTTATQIGWTRGLTDATTLPFFSGGSNDGGFYLAIIAGTGPTVQASTTGWGFGLHDSSAAFPQASSNFVTNARECIMFGKETADTNWYLIHKAAGTTTPTKVDSGVALAADQMFFVELKQAPGATTVTYTVKQITDFTTATTILSGTASTNLPAAGQVLTPAVYCWNTAATTNEIMFARMVFARRTVGNITFT